MPTDAPLRLMLPFATDDELARLVDFRETFIKWGRKFSFTAVKEGDIDRLLIAPSAWLGYAYRNDQTAGPVADFGCGAGIPGLVMALLHEAPYLLIDSHTKKQGFISHYVLTRKLFHVKQFDRRYRGEEDRPGDIARVVSRAAGSMGEVARLFPTVKEFDFFKGSDAGEEGFQLMQERPGVTLLRLDTPDWFGDLSIIRVTLP
ncbi:MAG: class I SAM-dependent methyltransferase [Nitrospinae bacterium]|nr:class I SAM-dependent methyltransferase [Nitrospinota bacterium]